MCSTSLPSGTWARRGDRAPSWCGSTSTRKNTAGVSSRASEPTRARPEVTTKTGASIVAIVRDGQVIANPGPDERFKAGDLVGVMGTPDQRATFLTLV